MRRDDDNRNDGKLLLLQRAKANYALEWAGPVPPKDRTITALSGWFPALPADTSPSKSTVKTIAPKSQTAIEPFKPWR